MHCHTVVLTISLSAGFLDSLHDPLAYVAPHDISDAAVPVYEHALTVSPVPSDSSGQSQVLWSIQGPALVADSSPGSQVPEVEIPQVDVECFLSRTHICQALYRYECHLAEANANRNIHFSVRHFRGMTSSEDSPSSSLWDVNGGLSKDNKTRWRSHLGMILRCTGRSNRKALTSSLMCGSAAGSYTQWCSTEATDVRCDIIVEGSSLSLKWCIM